MSINWLEVTRAPEVLERTIISQHLVGPCCIETHLTVVDGIFGILNVAVGSVVVHVRL